METARFKPAVLYPLDPRAVATAKSVGLRIVHDRRLPMAATISGDRLMINPTYDETTRTLAATILLADRLLYPPPTQPSPAASLGTTPEKHGRFSRISRFLTALGLVVGESPAPDKAR